MVFLAGYLVASAYGLPNTGYIACQEMCVTLQNVVRQVSVPVIADGDTGYGSPKREADYRILHPRRRSRSDD